MQVKVVNRFTRAALLQPCKIQMQRVGYVLCRALVAKMAIIAQIKWGGDLLQVFTYPIAFLVRLVMRIQVILSQKSQWILQMAQDFSTKIEE